MEVIIMKTLACKDAGVKCDFVAKGKTDEEVLTKVAEHGKKVHGMKDSDFATDKVQKFRSLIHEESQQRV
jgi:predicted small metal-binding protein